SVERIHGKDEVAGSIPATSIEYYRKALFDKVFSYFCPKFALIVKKSLDMNVYYGRIGLRNMKGVKQMNKQLVIQQAIFYHTLLSKQENKAH
ncbi:TPA: hypothetical protein ACIRID_002021, partial [Streptococcus suis]